MTILLFADSLALWFRFLLTDRNVHSEPPRCSASKPSSSIVARKLVHLTVPSKSAVTVGKRRRSVLRDFFFFGSGRCGSVLDDDADSKKVRAEITLLCVSDGGKCPLDPDLAFAFVVATLLIGNLIEFSSWAICGIEDSYGVPDGAFC